MRTALVTGANRGLGFEASRQLGQLGLRVVVSARDPANARQAADALAGEGLDVTPWELDVASDESAGRLGELGPVDVLVNNAGVAGERSAWVPADDMLE